ncbi:MAG: alkaline phosphatase [Bacteroidota bacterium]
MKNCILKKGMIKCCLALVVMFLCLSCGNKQVIQVAAPVVMPKQPMTSQPKNIILMIGDGMGLSQITAAMYTNGNALNLERFPIVGLIKTHSSDNLVTDSAAGATAFACGVKTYNGAIGIDANGQAKKTILEEAEENKLATGMVATSTIVHATPAAFIAHQKLRAFYEPIAADFMKTEIDFFVGGGKKYFDRRSSDDRNLYAELEKNNYVVSDYFKNKDLGKTLIDENKNFAYFTADDDPVTVTTGRDYLYAASVMGMNFLKKHSDQGFFMMIEGSQIDWGGHANNASYVISELLDFDKTVGAALEFAEKDGETLVIVTADHETGGLSIKLGSKMNKLKTDFSTGDHTASLIPVFAYGPGAELFSGVYENTAIYSKMRRAFGF